MVFDTTGIPSKIMQLLPLVSELFFAIDIAASSSLGYVQWSNVVSSLQTFSLGQSFGLGVGGSCFYSGSFETTACASIRAHEDSAVTAMQWLLSLCNHSVPTAERIRVYVHYCEVELLSFFLSCCRCAEKLRRSCLEQMQEPEVASTLLATRDVWDDISSVALVNPDRQKPILTALLEQLNDGGEASVVDLVRELHATVLDPARLQMFVVGPNCHQSLVPKPSPLSEQLTSLVAQAYSGRPFPLFRCKVLARWCSLAHGRRWWCVPSARLPCHVHGSNRQASGFIDDALVSVVMLFSVLI